MGRVAKVVVQGEDLHIGSNDAWGITVEMAWSSWLRCLCEVVMSSDAEKRSILNLRTSR
jgi:hypothetical protein